VFDRARRDAATSWSKRLHNLSAAINCHTVLSANRFALRAADFELGEEIQRCV
jgi:hypothetical protein